MVIELYKTPRITHVHIPKTSHSYKTILQESGFIPVSVTDIRDWDLMIEQLGIVPLYTDMKHLYGYDGWYDGELGEYIRFRDLANVIPSTKFDLGTKTIELTELEIYNLKNELMKEGMKSDVEQKWEEMVSYGEIPEDLNPDYYEILDLVESRQSGDFTYNDAYWRTIEDAIEDYIKEVQDETI
ncbi:MAG: hypothetical protein J6S14_15635 [Clostridia bacterium]|nr:hypothetical protein [Clostridia bacterium]